MSLTGKLLISHPNCPKDSIFYKTVIYLYQDLLDNGSIGVILNKPSEFTLQHILADKKIDADNRTVPLYHGGPVNTNALILLHTNEWNSLNTAHASNGLCVSSDTFMLEKIANKDEPKNWKLFGGLCGWAPGQLQAELEGKYPYRPENSWLIAEANLHFIFKVQTEKKWSKAIEMSRSQMFDQYF